MAYTEKEIESFRKKDVLYSRFAALKAATTNNEGKGKKAATLKKEADEYYGWLRQDQGDSASQPDEEKGVCDTLGSGQLPVPTSQQKKVLDAIYSKIGVASGQRTEPLQAKVLDWAFEVHGQRSYPTKLSSIEGFLEWNKKNNESNS